MNSVRDIAWLAGILEGEGSFHSYMHQKRWLTARISINMTDRDVIARIAKIIKCTSFRGPYKNDSHLGKKPLWALAVSGRRAIKWMERLYPHMGQRRRSQISKVLKDYALYVAKDPRRRNA